MAPEPVQEPSENLDTSNLNVNIGVTNDTDSEDDDTGHTAGYVPLSQFPIEGDSLNEDDDEEEEYERTSISQLNTNNLQSPEISQSSHTDVDPETINVWSSTCERSNIDLDAEKIDQVKTAMASFTLPSTAIPEWATSILEDQWKEKLIDRIKEIQNK